MLQHRACRAIRSRPQTLNPNPSPKTHLRRHEDREPQREQARAGRARPEAVRHLALVRALGPSRGDGHLAAADERDEAACQGY